MQAFGIEGFNSHMCACCNKLLPNDSKTGWENWLYLGPGGDKGSAHMDRLFSLVSWGTWVEKKMVWKGDYGLFLPLCKNCMVKLIKSLPEYNVYNSEKEKESLQSAESNIEWAKGQGKIKAPDQASYEKLKVVSDQNNRQDGAIIAGMLRQQLMKMVSNARETYEEEALEKAKAKKAKAEEDKTAAELAEQLQSTMLEDADKANEARTIDCEM